MSNDDFIRRLYKQTLELNGVPFDEEEFDTERARAEISAALSIEKEKITKIIIRLIEGDEDSPDAICGFYMVDEIEYYDDHQQLRDSLHQKAFDFHMDQFGPGDDCISVIAKKLKIDPNIIEIL